MLHATVTVPNKFLGKGRDLLEKFFIRVYEGVLKILVEGREIFELLPQIVEALIRRITYNLHIVENLGFLFLINKDVSAWYLNLYLLYNAHVIKY